jgi:hypothetical protein
MTKQENNINRLKQQGRNIMNNYVYPFGMATVLTLIPQLVEAQVAPQKGADTIPKSQPISKIKILATLGGVDAIKADTTKPNLDSLKLTTENLVENLAAIAGSKDSTVIKALDTASYEYDPAILSLIGLSSLNNYFGPDYKAEKNVDRKQVSENVLSYDNEFWTDIQKTVNMKTQKATSNEMLRQIREEMKPYLEEKKEEWLKMTKPKKGDVNYENYLIQFKTMQGLFY